MSTTPLKSSKQRPFLSTEGPEPPNTSTARGLTPYWLPTRRANSQYANLHHSLSHDGFSSPSVVRDPVGSRSWSVLLASSLLLPSSLRLTTSISYLVYGGGGVSGWQGVLQCSRRQQRVSVQCGRRRRVPGRCGWSRSRKARSPRGRQREAGSSAASCRRSLRNMTCRRRRHEPHDTTDIAHNITNTD